MMPDENHILLTRLEYQNLIYDRRELQKALTMLKVFKACIETGKYPEKGSSCHKKIDDILNA